MMRLHEKSNLNHQETKMPSGDTVHSVRCIRLSHYLCDCQMLLAIFYSSELHPSDRIHFYCMSRCVEEEKLARGS